MKMETKGERREAKRHKAQHGMRVSGRSVFTIQRIEGERAKKAKKGFFEKRLPL